MKQCVGCGVDKSSDSFTINRAKRDGLESVCRSCKAQRNRRQQELRGRIYNKRQWQGRLKKRIASLGEPVRCEICGSSFSENTGQYGRPHWDHNHETGKGRGWLCINCNTGLGAFADNPRILARAIDYLRVRGGAISRPLIQ